MSETPLIDKKRQSVTKGRFVSRARVGRCNAVTALHTGRYETPAHVTPAVVPHSKGFSA